MTVVLIGSGNVATVLGKIIQQAGHTIVQVISRNINHASQLAAQFRTAHTDNWNEIADAELYLIAVSDTSITQVAAALRLPGKLVVHSSGSVSMNVLSTISDAYGILYPLQSLRKELTAQPVIPLLIEGNSEETLQQLEPFAYTISKVVSRTTDDQRLKLHTAAVIVSNFTNYLYTLAAEFCMKERSDFSLLYPLITEVATRIKDNNPANLQTGPAIRGDKDTIQKHLQILSEYPEIKLIYSVMTNAIINHPQP